MWTRNLGSSCMWAGLWGSSLSPIIFAGRSVLFKQQLYEGLIIHMTLWIKAAHSLMSHSVNGMKLLEKYYEHEWGFGKWAIKPGQRDGGRLPIGWDDWAIPWKKGRGGREKQTRWEEQHEERHRRMMCSSWSGKRRPMGVAGAVHAELENKIGREWGKVLRQLCMFWEKSEV